MDLEIIGIGSALVDITVQTDEDFLRSENLPKGGMTLVDAERSRSLLEKLAGQPMEFSPGGATANVMASFAYCGGRAGFIGKTGCDEMGDYFAAETERAGVTFIRLVNDDLPTGTGLTLVTPDGERTFATHLGAAMNLAPGDLSAEMINQAPILHLEAYLVFNRELFDFILRSSRGQRISMDLSSFDVVRENLEYLERIAAKYLDIVFANEDESLAFTGLAPADSLKVLARLCDMAIIKEGEKGSHLANGSHRVFLPAEKVWVTDTNGAGDAYAGAVLFGLSRGMSISACGRIGTRAGSLAVSRLGARSTEEHARILRDFAGELDLMMTRRLEAGSLTPEVVVNVGREIAGFHRRAETCPEPEKYGSVEWIGTAVSDALRQLEPYIGVTLSQAQFDSLTDHLTGFLSRKAEAFAGRVESGKIIACHGELHMEHICLGDAVTILDCLEFDERFSYSDPANDVGFLAVDLDFHGRSDLAEIFVDAYVRESGDTPILTLLPFYKAHRACVRGWLVSSRLDDEAVSEQEVKAVLATAEKFFGLAVRYATREAVNQG